jgi:hypothetical protein
VKAVNKFRNIKILVDGINFDSKKEARRYGELKLLKHGGIISAFEMQVRFPILFDGEKICTYIADFVHFDMLGNRTIEDCKSEFTRKNPVYRLKKKMMKIINNLEIVEV